MTNHYHIIAGALERLTSAPAAQVAAEAGLSPQYFQKLFKRYVGINPKQFRGELTLADIKRRLIDGERVWAATMDAGLSGSGRAHDLFVSFDAVSPGEFRSGGRGVSIVYGRGGSPYGDVFVAATRRGVCALRFVDDDGGGDIASYADSIARKFAGATIARDDAAARRTAEQVFCRAPTPLHARGTNFQINVWRALLAIPPGRVMAYGELARALTGSAVAARAVAAAAAQNPIACLIPCHRLLAADGDLRGYAWGIARKRRILATEFAANPLPAAHP